MSPDNELIITGLHKLGSIENSVDGDVTLELEDGDLFISVSGYEGMAYLSKNDAIKMAHWILQKTEASK